MFKSHQVSLNEAVATLGDAHRRVVELRYLGFMTWEEIAAVMEKDETTIKRLHKEAILHLKAVHP